MTWVSLFTAVVLSSVSASFTAAAPQAATASASACTLRATLVGPEGRPAPGARLGVESLTIGRGGADAGWLAVADEAGRVELELPPDLYRWAAVSAEHPATEPRRLDLGGSCRGAELGRVALAAGVALAGRAVDPEGEPVAGARVRVDDPRPELSFLDVVQGAEVLADREVETGPDGRFEVAGLAPDLEHWMWVNHPAHRPRRADATPEGEPVVVALEPAAVVEVEVVDSAGRPIVGAEVRVETLGAGRQYGGIQETLRTDSDGRFVAGGVEPGEVRVDVLAPGYERASRALAVAAGETADIRLALEPVPGGPVELRFVDEGGRPVPGAAVAFASTPRTPDGVYLQATTDEAGRVRWPRLPTGRYEMANVQAPAGFARQVREHELPAIEVTPAGVEAELVLRRPEGRRVEGRVVRAGTPDQGVPGVVLSIHAGAAGSIEARTGADGRFAVERLPLGEHTVYLGVPGVAGVAPRTLRVTADGPLPLLEVPAGVPVSGRLRLAAVVDPTGPWRVTARGPGGSAAGWMEEDLAFRFPPLAPGLWTVRAIGERAAGLAKVEVVAGAGEARVEIEVPAPPEGFPVWGTVTHGGRPLPDVRIGLRAQHRHDVDASFSAVTGADGRFEIAGAPAGSYHLTMDWRERVLSRVVEIDGPTDLGRELRFAWARGRVEHPGGDPSALTVRLSHLGPVEPQAVQVVSSHTYPGWLRPRTDGTFEVGPLEEGRWRLEVAAPGHVPARREIVVDGEDVEDLVLRLEPSPGLVVRVRRSDGTVPESVSVAYRREGGSPESVHRSGAAVGDGTVRLDHVAPGRLTVSAKSGYTESARVTAEVPGPPVELVLPPGGRLEIRAPFHAAGELESARVAVEPVAGSPGRSPYRAPRFFGDHPARATVFLVPGRYEVRIEREAAPPHVEIVEIRDHETSVVELPEP